VLGTILRAQQTTALDEPDALLARVIKSMALGFFHHSVESVNGRKA
jgi:hypothetical protein